MATAPRAIWKGHIRLSAVSCPVKLVGATTEAGRLHFRILNRKDKKPVKSAYLDEETGELVPSEEQAKGYEIEKGKFLVIDKEDIAARKMVSEHTLDIDGFTDRTSIDPIYFDKPYYIIPDGKPAIETYGVIREALLRTKSAALSSIVLAQRCHHVVIEPLENGLSLTTLRYAREMVAAEDVFEGLNKPKIDKESVEVAGMLIDKKKTDFDPSAFEDQYENALYALIEAKRSGKSLPKAPRPKPRENVVNLLDVLKKSLSDEGGKKQPKQPKTKRKSAA